MPNEYPTTISWKGLEYQLKPFTLDCFYAVADAINNAQENGKNSNLRFQNLCIALLEGTTDAAKRNLNSHGFSKSVRTEKDNLAGAFFVMRQVDFFSNTVLDKGILLKNPSEKSEESAPQEKTVRSNRKSQKASAQEQEHSG